MGSPLKILHVDMDAFFASVEQLDEPSLRGKPVLVGGSGRRAVVAAASYEARKYGCHSAQPMAVAKRLCPTAIVVPVRGARYREVSEKIFGILDTFTPLMEPLSIDEAFLDVSGTEGLFGSAETVARTLKDRIQSEVSLTASVGVAPNKFLAKLASDMEKPDGLMVLTHERFDQLSSTLPATKIWGLGPASAKKLDRLGIQTVEHLRRVSESWLERHFGSSGKVFYQLARGIDDRRVTPDHQAKSIGQERTFERDLEDPGEVLAVLLGEVEQVGRRLRKQGLCARSVAVKIRYGDFETITRRATLLESTASTKRLWETARDLFSGWARESFQPVRLIGVTSGDLASGQMQSILFPDPQEDRLGQLDRATDRIVERFGVSAIQRGATLKSRGESETRREN